MAALTALALGAGLASMAVGTYNMFEGKSQQQAGLQQQQAGYATQAEAARQAAGISKEQAASSVQYAGQERDININAADQSVAASQASLAINKGIVSEQQSIEATKRQAMEVDARRQQLEIIRGQQRARSLGLTNSTAQGSSKGSGLQGGYGQASGQSGVNLLGVQQALQSGENIFDANANITGYNSQMAELTNQYNIQQAATQTAKANLTYGYAQTNAGYQTRQADVQTLNSQGAGQVAIGGGVAQAGSSQYQMGQSLFAAGPSIFSMGTNVSQLSGSTFNFGNYFMGGGSPSGYGR
jgi:hypothetical protein